MSPIRFDITCDKCFEVMEESHDCYCKACYELLVGSKGNVTDDWKKVKEQLKVKDAIIKELREELKEKNETVSLLHDEANDYLKELNKLKGGAK